jgi:hypothetical protein
MGFSVSDLVGGLVSLAPIPGAGAVGNFISGLDDGRGNNNPYVPDVIERVYNPAIDNQQRPAQGANMAGCAGIQTVMQPTFKQIAQAPPGYVIVKCPNTGQKLAMLKPVARALGLWKPRRKPPISAKDWNCLKKADSTIKKLKRVEKMAGMVNRARGRKTR